MAAADEAIKFVPPCPIGKSAIVVVGTGLRRCVYDHNIHDAPWGVDKNEKDAGCMCTDAEVRGTKTELVALIAAVWMVGIDPELDSEVAILTSSP